MEEEEEDDEGDDIRGSLSFIVDCFSLRSDEEEEEEEEEEEMGSFASGSAISTIAAPSCVIFAHYDEKGKNKWLTKG